jgi:gliding motility-associated-like protein
MAQTNVSCNAGSDGTATVTPAGGTGTYGYIWNDPPPAQTTATATGLSASAFTVTITDSNGCTTTSSVTITQPPAITASISAQTNVTCFGGTDGSATVNASGGTGALSYLWNNPAPAQTSTTATGLSASMWTVIVTDQNNCFVSTSVTITQPPALTGNMAHTDVTCNGAGDGTATFTVNGGTGAITYIWDDPAAQTSQTATGLAPANYSVTATDGNNCTVTGQVTITQNPPFLTSTSQTEVSCNGGSDGTATLIANGGVAPYSYVWDNPPPAQSSATATGLAAGPYNVTATDAMGCTSTNSVTITEPPLLTSSISNFSAVSCYGAADGNATAAAAGGTPPYSYHWSNGAPSQTMNNVGPGIYFVTVTDNKSCTSVSSVTIVQPPEIVMATSPDFIACVGQQYIINMSATGGTPPYTYYWNSVPSSSSLTISPTVPVTYSGYVVDADGCISNIAYTSVSIYPPLVFSIAISDDSICPGEQVIVSSSVSGGDGGPYIITDQDGNVVTTPYSWYPQENSSVVLTATDGCNYTASADTSVFVYQLPPNSFNADITAGCQPLTVHFNEGSPYFGQTFLWNFGDADLNNLSTDHFPVHTYENAGTYNVALTVTSPEGCTNYNVFEDMITVYPTPISHFITNPNPPDVTIINPVIQFNNLSTGAGSVFWFFGDGDSTHIWNPQHTFPDTGSYTVMLVAISPEGCRDTSIYLIHITDEFTFYAPTCFSPDNDNINDVWRIFGHGIDKNNFTLIIYDRWGEDIFTTHQFNPETNTSEGWDGKVKGGKIADIGTYTWLVIYRDLNHIEHEKSGAVTVIR